MHCPAQLCGAQPPPVDNGLPVAQQEEARLVVHKHKPASVLFLILTIRKVARRQSFTAEPLPPLPNNIRKLSIQLYTLYTVHMDCTECSRYPQGARR
jgi:hypothetical protein